MTNTDRLPAELLAILNAPCPPIPTEIIKQLNTALNAGIKKIVG